MISAVAVGGVLIGLAVIALAFLRPQLALVTLVALDVSNINGVIADQIGISPYKPQLGLAVLVLLIMVRRRQFRFGWSPVLLGVLILFAAFCLSLVSAADPVTSQALLISRARDLVYFVVVFTLILSTRRVRPVTQAAVTVLAALAALTVLHEYLLHNQGDLFGLSRVPLVQEGGAATPRHAGTSSDVNFWARLLIMFSPLSLSLWAASRGRWPRLFWLACAVSLGLGVYLTQSRGGFIALFIAVVLWLVLAGGRYRRSLLFGPLVLAVLVPLSGIGSRLSTLSAITSGSTANADPSVVTRKRLQLDAWQMFLDSPATGHGIGSYGTLFPRYDRVADYYQPVDIVAAAHNFYLEQAADGGVLLLLAWAIFIGTILFCAFRARALGGRHDDRTNRLLALGVLAGVVGWLFASIFLHLSDFRALLVLAAVAAAVDVQVRRQQTVADSAPGQTPTRPRAVRSVAVLGAIMASTGLAAVGLWVSGSTPYTNAAELAVVPATRAVDPSVAYQLDVINRGLITPTLAAVVNSSVTSSELARQARVPDDPSVSFRAVQSRLGGAVTVTITGPNKPTTDRLGTAAVTLSQAKVAGLDAGYRLEGEMSLPYRAFPWRRWGALGLSLMSLATGLMLVRSTWNASTRRRAGLRNAREAWAAT